MLERSTGTIREAEGGTSRMECLGPQCATMLLEWIKARAAGAEGQGGAPEGLLKGILPGVAARATLQGVPHHRR